MPRSARPDGQSTSGRLPRRPGPQLPRRIRVSDRRWRAAHLNVLVDVHHRVPWSEDGETIIDNLVLLCHYHHTRIHLGMLTL
ncbi:MAG TPA: HNH endonuclease signature motif containing protein [Acidimicrobiia bacterium]|nr:HNH endonuclease signature motif containing protein [Acidimicrobiia bacterium]